jgi:toxin ParE1/3/4
MRLVITEPAEDDLKKIVRYVSAENPTAAERVYREIKIAIFGLLDFPQQGKAGRIFNTRELVLSGLPFVIVYNVNEITVTILAIFHAKMDLTKHMEDRTP